MNQHLPQNIIQELGLESLPKERQEEIVLKLGTVIYQGILMRALAAMTDEQKNTLDKELEEKGDDALLPFLQKHIPNFETLVDEEIAKIKKDSADFLNSLQ